LDFLEKLFAFFGDFKECFVIGNLGVEGLDMAVWGFRGMRIFNKYFSIPKLLKYYKKFMETEKIQLPKIRKILPTNLVDISCFVDLKQSTESRDLRTRKDQKLKSNLQSPKTSQTAKEINLRALKKSTNGSVMNHSKELDSDRSTESKSIRFRFFRYFEMENKERLPTSSPNIRKGPSGYSVSKLHRSRFQIKNRSRYYNS
jgi:hypothetical protein